MKAVDSMDMDIEVSSGSFPTTPTKRRTRASAAAIDYTAIHMQQIEKVYFVLKAIEKNTRPLPPRLATRYQNAMGVVVMFCAMMLSITMLYVLWIGYYTPDAIFSHVFFIDRLNDLRELIGHLRDGSIFAAMTRLFMTAAEDAVTERYGRAHPDLPPVGI